MIGRSAYKYPLKWSEIDQKIYGENPKSKKASEIIFSLVPYMEKHLKNEGKTWDICKHLINLLEQKVGKIEVMEVLLKILTLKMVEVEEKEVLQATLKYLKKGIKNPFLVTLKLFCLRNQYLILV